MLFSHFHDLHVRMCSFLDVRSLIRLGNTCCSFRDVERLAREIHNWQLPHLKGLGFENWGKKTGLRRLAWYQLCQQFDRMRHSDPYGCSDWNDYDSIARTLFVNNPRSKTLRRLCVYMNRFYDETVNWNWVIQKTPFLTLSPSSISFMLKIKP